MIKSCVICGKLFECNSNRKVCEAKGECQKKKNYLNTKRWFESHRIEINKYYRDYRRENRKARNLSVKKYYHKTGRSKLYNVGGHRDETARCDTIS